MMIKGIHLEDYGLKSHINYGTVHSSLRGGKIVCPQHPELHGKQLRVFEVTEMHECEAPKRLEMYYYIDGESKHFESAEELVKHYTIENEVV